MMATFNVGMFLLMLCLPLVYSAIDAHVNCTFRNGNLRNPFCPAVIKVNWWPIPPYVYLNQQDKGQLQEDEEIPEHKLNGTMKEIIERIMRKCCGECVKFSYEYPLKNFEELKKSIGANESVLNFPVYGTSLDNRFQNFPFSPIVEAPGIIYIQPHNKPRTSAEDVVKAAFSGGPVLALTVILASLAGVVMWCLDTRSNPEDYPRFTGSGFWQGFWWAFISMTTVGYGDKVPKSFFARIFAFLWLLVGLVIIGIFTSDVTTALTTLSMTNDITLFGKNVVVFEKSEEARYAADENAVITSVTNISDFVATIKSGDVAGGLTDAYVAGSEAEMLSRKNGVRVANIIDKQFSYGVALSNGLTNPYTSKCLSRQLSADESWIVYKIKRELPALPDNGTKEQAADMFSASSTIYQSALYTCLILALFLIACGLAWENLYWKPKQQREADKSKHVDRQVSTSELSYDDLVANQCHDMDEAMRNEVIQLYDGLLNKMMEIRELHLQNDPDRAKDVDERKIIPLDCHASVKEK